MLLVHGIVRTRTCTRKNRNVEPRLLTGKEGAAPRGYVCCARASLIEVAINPVQVRQQVLMWENIPVNHDGLRFLRCRLGKRLR